jgi:hypothetical protein
LTIQPYALRGADYLRGQEIELQLVKNQLSGVVLKKQSVVISRVDTTQARAERYDLLTGEQIDLTLTDQQISDVSVKGQATSYYHAYEDSLYKGINKTLGDEIRIFFNKGKMDRILVKSNPSVSNGVFYPPEKSKVLESELNERLQQARRGNGTNKKKISERKRQN